jgi:DNA repair protein SbcD/Mre11
VARFVHVSDSHLGYQAYARLTPEGLNQREVDAYEAFAQVIDWSVENRPDFVLHTGDLFDSPRPTNRAIAFALAQVRRLSEAGIPTILLSGNHDAPRLRETGSIFRIFEGLRHVHPVYKGPRERIEIASPAGPVAVYAVPQAISQQAFEKELVEVAPREGELSVLAVHGTLAGVDGLFTNELNELLIPASILDKGFGYVALGHFHGHRLVGPRAYYAGSTERTSIHEWDQEKSFSVVSLLPEALDVRPHSLRARPMLDLKPVDATGMDPEALLHRLRQALQAQSLESAVVRLRVRNAERASAKALDTAALEEAAKAAFQFSLHVDVRQESGAVQAPAGLGHLDDEFAAFLEQRAVSGFDKDRLRAEALRLLAEAREAPDAA